MAPGRYNDAMSTEQVAAHPHTINEPGLLETFRSRRSFFKRNLTRKVSAAVAVWVFETRTVTPIALFLVANLGRWNGALVMGTMMAVYSAVFLFLLDGERVIEEFRSWLRQRKWGHQALHIAEKPGRSGTLQRLLVAPLTVMFQGPFWRAVAYRVARVRQVPAYLLSVGGSYPHSLFWTGLVLGGLWEAILQPAWDATIGPPLDDAVDAIWDAITVAAGALV
jgi:hypothetical protein